MIGWDFLKHSIKNYNSYKMNRDMIGFLVEDILEPVKFEDAISYSKATKDDNITFYKENDLAPPFFLFKLILPSLKNLIFQKDLRLNILRVVHTDQEFKWHSSLRMNDQLKVKIKIQDIVDTSIGEKIILTAKGFKDKRLVVEGTTGFIVRNKRKAAPQKKNEKQELKETFRLAVQTNEGQQLIYAKASGDHNLIHTNNYYARIAGLQRTIMHGACVMAMSSNAIIKYKLNGNINRLNSISGRFGKPTFPGEGLIIKGYDLSHSKSVSFEVLSSSGKPVFQNGLLKFT